MRIVRRLTALASMGIPLGFAVQSGAAEPPVGPQVRDQFDQRGDFAVFGNTIGFDCYAGDPPIPAPEVGTVDCSGATNVDDSSPDIFWFSDDAAGTATANATITAETAGSTAVLVLPDDGATITYARLYWAGYLPTGELDSAVQVRVPGATDPVDVTADDPRTNQDGVEIPGSWTVVDGDTGRLALDSGAGSGRCKALGVVGQTDQPVSQDGSER